jgi:zinc transport system ATP-binding protein
VTLVLDVEDLSISFGGAEIFRGLTFRVAKGSSLAIIGPNGSGKTVLFKALVGSLPYRGRICWAPGVRIGYVPQKLDLERDLPLTGVDLLAAKASVVKARDDVTAALQRVGLGHEAAKPIGALSGGQFQRLLVALALVGSPNVLLLDEPTAGVDAPGQEKLNELVRRLQAEQDLTVLLISHDLSVVYRYATDVLCLARERACFGPPRTIAISHVALPGIGVALALGVHPLFGASAMLFFGALLIWALERRTRIATETVIGVVFSAALAVGSLMSSQEELVDALFGGPGTLTAGEIVFGLAGAAAIVAFILRQRSSLILALVSPEIARTSGIDVARLDLLFLETFALTVALGLRYLGVLLMGSLIIIPAATAKRIAGTLTGMLALPWWSPSWPHCSGPMSRTLSTARQGR